MGEVLWSHVDGTVCRAVLRDGSIDGYLAIEAEDDEGYLACVEFDLAAAAELLDALTKRIEVPRG